MMISSQKVVTIHYVLTDETDEVLDSSQGKEPLTYLHGAGGLIPGLEKELEGKAPGDELQVSIPPSEGYGEQNPGLVQTIPISAFEGIDRVEPGMQFNTSGPDGNTMLITVTGVNGDEVTIDGNHPLAGVTLNFDVNIVEVRDATDEELQHGHAH